MEKARTRSGRSRSRPTRRATHPSTQLTVGSDGGWFATATATDTATGDTSEFSACVTIAAASDDCPADFDGDGTPSVADFSAFRTAYLAGDMAADFTGDGVLGVSDFTAFRSAYLAGCP